MITTTTTKIKDRDYLFDIYHIKEKAILWIKEEKDGNTKALSIHGLLLFMLYLMKTGLESLLKDEKISWVLKIL